jgi:hypothetical protein
MSVIRCFSVGVALAALSAAMVAASSQRDVDLARSAALCVFEARINEYAALHRRLQAPLPLKPSDSPYLLTVKREYLASAVKRRRPTAKQGDMFAPEVAPVFRELIARALVDRDVEAMLRDLFEDQPLVLGFQPRVHDTYPDWATHEMPVILLQWLPPLPEELEYRLIDHDLLLWDADADLIVDVLSSAVRRPST